MTDVRRLLERQAEWQRARGGLSWPEKVHMAEAMREAIHQLRSGHTDAAGLLHSPGGEARATSS